MPCPHLKPAALLHPLAVALAPAIGPQVLRALPLSGWVGAGAGASRGGASEGVQVPASLSPLAPPPCAGVPSHRHRCPVPLSWPSPQPHHDLLRALLQTGATCTVPEHWSPFAILPPGPQLLECPLQETIGARGPGSVQCWHRAGAQPRA